MDKRTVRIKLAVLVGLCVTVAILAGTAAVAAAPPKVDVHGFVENRFYFQPGEAHFEIERLDLQLAGTLSDDTKALVEWYYHTWAPSDKLWLESAYVDFDKTKGGRLRFGRGRNFVFGITPSGGTRKTSEYGLVSEAVTLDRIEGVQYTREQKDNWSWGLAVYNGMALGSRPTMDIHVTEHAGIKHLCDRENALRDKLEASARITKRITPELQIDLSARASTLNATDLKLMRDNFNQNWTSDRKLRWGPTAMYRDKGWVANAELYLEKTSSLSHYAWALLVGHESKNPRGMSSYVRYGQQIMGLESSDIDPATPGALSNQLTADYGQWMISLKQPLRPAVNMEIGFIINDAHPVLSGVSVPDSNDAFVEVMAMF